MKTPAPLPLPARPATRFRAVKSHPGYRIESSHDGSMWTGAVEGLDAAAVQKQFERLEKQGAVIVREDK